MARLMLNDGGRAHAGFKGDAGDCVVRAIAIATNLPYREVYESITVHCSTERRTKRTPRKTSPRTGVYRKTYERYLRTLGWVFVPTMGIGTGCKVHLREDELPSGRIIARLSKHLCAVIDGVVHDTHDPRRGGTRCVYGYFTRTP